MTIWTSILQARNEIAKQKRKTTLTIGNFDGVHQGHQAIMRKTCQLAKRFNGLAIALTFANHTDGLWGEKPLLINSPAFRRELLAQQNLDAILEIDFNQDFAKLNPEVFFKTWLVDALHTAFVVVGHDFKFGSGSSGDFLLLKELGKTNQVAIERIAPVKIAGEVVSSSRIRQLLACGQIECANKMLGYPFTILGEVSEGERRGRQLGYPTANIHLESEYLLPSYGVYLVKLSKGMESYHGIANVGMNPTFGNHAPRVEVYLFDVEVNLYHQAVRVQFFKFIRPENRFAGPEALKSQIANDVRIAKNALANSLHT